MLSHAWPFVLVLILVFGGGIVRSIMKALFGGLTAAINVAPPQDASSAFPQTPISPTAASGIANVEAVRIAVATALAPKGDGNVDVAALLRELAAPASPPPPVPTRLEKPARYKTARETISRNRQTPLGESLSPLDPAPRLEALLRLAVLAPLEPRVPLAPLAARRA